MDILKFMKAMHTYDVLVPVIPNLCVVDLVFLFVAWPRRQTRIKMKKMVVKNLDVLTSRWASKSQAKLQTLVSSEWLYVPWATLCQWHCQWHCHWQNDILELSMFHFMLRTTATTMQCTAHSIPNSSAHSIHVATDNLKCFYFALQGQSTCKCRCQQQHGGSKWEPRAVAPPQGHLDVLETQESNQPLNCTTACACQVILGHCFLGRFELCHMFKQFLCEQGWIISCI